MSFRPVVNLFRDKVIRGEVTMEAYARRLIQIDGSSPGPPCLREDQGARLTAPAPVAPGQQDLFTEV